MLTRTFSPRASSIVYLSLGTNLGDREANLRRALAALPSHGIEIDQVSPVYQTAPQDVTDQPWFLNMAARGWTRLGPEEVLSALLTVERAGGRERVQDGRYGPRTIDIDLLLYDTLCLKRAHLEVPHPRMQLRRFVLQPLVDLNPLLRHPETGELLCDLLASVQGQPIRRHPAVPD